MYTNSKSDKVRKSESQNSSNESNNPISVLRLEQEPGFWMAVVI